VGREARGMGGAGEGRRGGRVARGKGGAIGIKYQ